jgi:predicted NBD/HSP70 family sugar kinase
VDGRALARHLGEPTPDDPRSYALQVLDRLPADSAAMSAVTAVASCLGAGVAGLVNAHDPDMVTLGGLAGPLRRAAPGAFDAAYVNGLMAFHRSQPPPVIDSIHGDDGPLHGAAIVGLDQITTEVGIAAWAADLGRPDA